MKIWLHINGVQEGPYEADQLPLDRMDAETPVWYEGLEGWLPAGQAEVTARILAEQDARAEVTPQAEAPYEPTQQDAMYTGYQQSYNQQQPSLSQMQESAPSYLVWSLLLTILCCNPVGLVPILLGAGVSSRLRAHDFEGAKRQSETTAWWLIITIVTSLVMMPFTFMMFAF